MKYTYIFVYIHNIDRHSTMKNLVQLCSSVSERKSPNTILINLFFLMFSMRKAEKNTTGTFKTAYSQRPLLVKTGYEFSSQQTVFIFSIKAKASFSVSIRLIDSRNLLM